jgi:hypothetical protein
MIDGNNAENVFRDPLIRDLIATSNMIDLKATRVLETDFGVDGPVRRHRGDLMVARAINFLACKTTASPCLRKAPIVRSWG